MNHFARNAPLPTISKREVAEQLAIAEYRERVAKEEIARLRARFITSLFLLSEPIRQSSSVIL
jgi:hypothetical protein